MEPTWRSSDPDADYLIDLGGGASVRLSEIVAILPVEHWNAVHAYDNAPVWAKSAVFTASLNEPIWCRLSPAAVRRRMTGPGTHHHLIGG